MGSSDHLSYLLWLCVRGWQSITGLLLGQVVPDQGLKSRITAPLTSMLKTSNTKLVEPTKVVVGVGGSGRNRAKPVGKHKSDNIDGDGGCNGDFDMTFQVTRWRSRHCSSKTMVVFDRVSKADHEKPIPVALDWGSTLLVEVSIPTGRSSLPRVRQVQPCCADIQVFMGCAQPLTSMLRTSSSTDSSTSAAQIVVEFDKVDVVVVLLASWLKSRQKVGESSKSPKSFKGLKNL